MGVVGPVLPAMTEIQVSMLDVVRRGAGRLDPEARSAIIDFVRGQACPEGGFAGRSRDPDLYYTMFALDSLAALAETCPAEGTSQLLCASLPLADLDLIHQVCWVRCAAHIRRLGQPLSGAPSARAWADSIAACRAADGGYATEAGGQASAYGAFMAALAYGDLGMPLPDVSLLVASLGGLKAGDGGYANQPGRPTGQTPATAAALAVTARYGGAPVRPVVEWLCNQFTVDGGLRANPFAPAADLLSTATGLFALSLHDAVPPGCQAAVSDYVDQLWADSGGFVGHVLDEVADVEYTFYALMALGAVSFDSIR